MTERLFHAYHTEGLNIAEPQILERLGNEAGLDPTDVRTLLGGNDGVTGVPSLVIDGQPPVSGVQTPEELRQLLNQHLTALDSAAPHASLPAIRTGEPLTTKHRNHPNGSLDSAALAL